MSLPFDIDPPYGGPTLKEEASPAPTSELSHVPAPVATLGTATPTAKMLTGLDPLQLRWLTIRMDAGTDAEASRTLNEMLPAGAQPVTKNRVRRWKDNPSFRQLLELCRNNKAEAFRVLVSGSLSGLAYRALESLLTGPTPYERKEGLRAFMDIVKSGGPSGDQINDLLEMFRTTTTTRILEVVQRPRELPPTPSGVIEGEFTYGS